MKTAKLLLIAGAAAVLAAPAWANITYMANESFDGATVNLSITTDGNLGVLSTGDITSWNIDITDGAGTFDLNSGNSIVSIEGSNLTATSTHLSFDFSSDGLLVFENGSFGANTPFWCASGDSRDCWGAATSGIGVSTQSPEIPIENEVLTDNTIIASTPEPATWALMLAGFAGLGSTLRMRRARKLAVV